MVLLLIPVIPLIDTLKLCASDPARERALLLLLLPSDRYHAPRTEQVSARVHVVTAVRSLDYDSSQLAA
jgi:hypothetical protein